jgi:pimeloyl-ACP methyl ester carboxylesterase
MPYINDLYYFVWQDIERVKEPLVLLHGAGGTHLFWPPQVRRISNLQIFALDLPGHGRSGGDGLRNIEGYAACVASWLDQIGVERALLGGHSMGSAIALQLALKIPARVAGLILIGAGARLRVHPDILNKAANEETFIDAVRMVVSASFADRTPARLKELAFQRMASTRQAILYGDFLACNEFDVMQDLSKIEQPVFVICGDQDRLTPLRYAEYLVDRLPNARLHVAGDAGHMVMLEKPVLVSHLIHEFICTHISG